MDRRSEEERSKGSKCGVDDGEPEVVDDGECHRFGQDCPERRSGLVYVARVHLRGAGPFLRLEALFHGLDGGRSDPLTKPPTSLLTSFNDYHVRTNKEPHNAAEVRHSRKYGILPRTGFRTSWEIFRVTGCENDSPTRGLLRVGENCALQAQGAYQAVTSSAHTRGKSPDTRALFAESVSSPAMVLTAPVFPWKNPMIE